MSIPRLDLLDGKRIAVELVVGQASRQVCGVGRFVQDPDLGPTVSILVTEPEGSFELLLDEKWNGSIEADPTGEYDYRLRFTQGASSPMLG